MDKRLINKSIRRHGSKLTWQATYEGSHTNSDGQAEIKLDRQLRPVFQGRAVVDLLDKVVDMGHWTTKLGGMLMILNRCCTYLYVVKTKI